jgi:hypothetical protein
MCDSFFFDVFESPEDLKKYKPGFLLCEGSTTEIDEIFEVTTRN